MSDTFLQEQHFDIDEKKGIYAVVNRFNDDDLQKENYENKMNDTSKGMSKSGNMRKAAAIPSFLYYNEPLLKEYHKNIGVDPSYAKRCLKLWLSLYPEYYANAGRI